MKVTRNRVIFEEFTFEQGSFLGLGLSVHGFKVCDTAAPMRTQCLLCPMCDTSLVGVRPCLPVVIHWNYISTHYRSRYCNHNDFGAQRQSGCLLCACFLLPDVPVSPFLLL